MDIQIIAQCGLISVLSNGTIINTQHDILEHKGKHVSFTKRTIEPVAVTQTIIAVETPIPVEKIVAKIVKPGVTLVKKSITRDDFTDHMSLMGVSPL